MRTHNADNERIKRRYRIYLKEAKHCHESTLDVVDKALHRFESYTRFKNFKAFHIEQAAAFKRHLAEQTSQRTGEPLSASTVYATLNHLRNYFLWLAGQPGYRSRLSYSDAEYFNPKGADIRVAKARREQRMPTLEQIRHLLRTLPASSDVERRNRALIAFTLLTGARDSAIASFKLKHIDIVGGRVSQDGREVRTKFKRVTSWASVESCVPAAVLPVSSAARRAAQAERQAAPAAIAVHRAITVVAIAVTKPTRSISSPSRAM